MNLTRIGVVNSPVAKPQDEGWGEVISEIHLDRRYASGLKGLEQFSHVIIVFLVHQSSFDETCDLVRRPRGREDMPEVGIFAQRAKHRPNPLGVTAVRLIGVKDDVLTVKGLDAIDGTPVLDIKPYYPVFDRVDHCEVPNWVDELMKDYF